MTPSSSIGVVAEMRPRVEVEEGARVGAIGADAETITRPDRFSIFEI